MRWLRNSERYKQIGQTKEANQLDELFSST